MTIKTCNKCGAQVKDALENCPECGTSLQDSNRSYKKVILFVLILFNVLMLAWALSGIGGSAELVEGANTAVSENIAEESTFLGGSMMAIIWVIGDIVLGVLYFMSGKKR
ncbi:hypothetical protein UMM65_00760 [Aureibaculum sp. 2210JD6-5]|uniref:hypothetical protein n=1 Tax=Aureibaculum sp. 2210JD6-5 TaxID=3103957 RepID=UPI002AADE561|nr:hypothetical protein [Aureibaculum sp. 2210JD6-5]MDY7393760.1 hypothetical protein [Aureibaculum sp. 2210JD6-5]